MVPVYLVNLTVGNDNERKRVDYLLSTRYGDVARMDGTFLLVSDKSEMVELVRELRSKLDDGGLRVYSLREERVDAAGVCTSNLKLITQGEEHVFLNGCDLRSFPVILGDEGVLTVVRVGKKLRDRYIPGQRFAVQPVADVPPSRTASATGSKRGA